jgi:hypothetical protein
LTFHRLARRNLARRKGKMYVVPRPPAPEVYAYSLDEFLRWTENLVVSDPSTEEHQWWLRSVASDLVVRYPDGARLVVELRGPGYRHAAG